METTTTTVDFPPFSNPTAINSCFDQEYKFDHQERQYDDEVLSLRDLPLTTTYVVDHHRSSYSNNHSRSTSFEFHPSHHHHHYNNDDDDLLHDVISDGHLLPFTHPRRSLSLSPAATRFSSLTESQLRTSPATASTIRHSRSLNYRKLRRGGESNVHKSSLYRTNSSTSSSRIDNKSESTAASPRWYYWLVFGLPMRIPAEMAVTRSNSWSRRNIPPASLLPVERGCNNDGSRAVATRRLLSVLSCKSHGSVDVINTQY